MNNFNKSLLAVFMISLFSLVSIQSINRIVNGPQVLGEITGPTPTKSQVPVPQPISVNGVPCDVINSLQRTYCSNVPTPPQPTTSCRTGLSAFEPTSKCPPSATNISITYQSAKFTCIDNFSGTIPMTSKCYISDQLKSMAFEVCSKHPVCGPIPTDVVKPTLTPAPTFIYPTSTKPSPTKAPTSTPTPTKSPPPR